MVRSQKEKLQRLGGSPWIRKKIDEALNDLVSPGALAASLLLQPSM
jgi:hypothetical protein